jgi:NTE family protein
MPVTQTKLRIGLALGGGGARGLAHVPMLEAFDELGIRPSVISGCSMGALVGAMYAAGMSGRELREHCVRLLSNRVEFAKFVFGNRKTKLFDLINLGSLQALHLSGLKLADLAMPDHLSKKIEDCAIPLKIVSTNFDTMSETVHTTGDLLKAVAASIAIPGVIIGPKIAGHQHVDGGVVNPVPFDHIRTGTDIVVAIDVTGKPRPINDGKASNIELAVGSLLIMFHKLAESRRAMAPPDIYIEPAIDGFKPGDFFKAKEIFEAAQPAKNQLKRLLDKQINAQLIAGT